MPYIDVFYDVNDRRDLLEYLINSGFGLVYRDFIKENGYELWQDIDKILNYDKGPYGDYYVVNRMLLVEPPSIEALDCGEGTIFTDFKHGYDYEYGGPYFTVSRQNGLLNGVYTVGDGVFKATLNCRTYYKFAGIDEKVKIPENFRKAFEKIRLHIKKNSKTIKHTTGYWYILSSLAKKIDSEDILFNSLNFYDYLD